MPARQKRAYIALAMLVLLFVVGRPLVPKLGSASGRTAAGTVEIPAEVRAGTLHFAAGVDPGDQAWILAAITAARPEAQQLIAEVDGLVEIRTDLVSGDAIGLAHIGPGRRGRER